MNVPLEPIPTEQIVLVEKEQTRAKIRVQDVRASGTRQLTPLDKAYPWLLGASTCLSALLCWMYVSKPVIVTANTQATQATQDTQDPQTKTQAGLVDEGAPAVAAALVAHGSREPKSLSGDLVPSNNTLPGAQSGDAESVIVANPDSMDAHELASVRAGGDTSDISLGWEATNLKVQHILMADTGHHSQEKIVIDVPVLYQTRTMRWSPADVVKARTVLGRLMVYERNLSSLRQEGQTILKEWNQILEETVPAPALRADSPSLPYNHGEGSHTGGLLGSSPVIKVAQ